MARHCLIGFVFLFMSASVALADDEGAKADFLACSNMDMAACDRLVATPGLSDQIRSRAYVLRGIQRVKLQDLPGARVDIDAALGIDPTNSMAQQASLLLDKAAQQQAATPEMRCFKEPDLQQRLAACDQFVAKSAADPARQAIAYDGRAAAELDGDSFDAAITDLQAANRLDPSRPDGISHLMLAQYEAGRYEEALKSADLALKQSPTDPELLVHRGVLLYLTGKPSPAIAALTQLGQQNSADTIRLFIDVIRLEQHQDVKDDLKQQLANPSISVLGATILKFRLHEASAQSVLDEMEKVPPEQLALAQSQAYFNIGHQAWLDGDLPKARENLELVVKAHRPETFEYHASRVILKKIAG